MTAIDPLSDVIQDLRAASLQVPSLSLRELRRRFDQESSRLNRAIFSEHSSPEEIYDATRSVVATLIRLVERVRGEQRDQLVAK